MTRDFLPSRLSVDLALAALKRGDLADAANSLTSALRADPQNPDAYYHLARVYGLAGRDAAAVQVFRMALDALPHTFLSERTFVHYQGRAFDAKTTLNFFTAFAETTPTIRAYLAPSPLVGTYGPEQAAEQDAAIQRLLDERWSAWKGGQVPPPARADAFLSRMLPSGTPWPRTLVFMPHHVNANPDFVESSFASHVLASLRELGIASELHAADHLCFDAASPDSAWSGRKPKSVALSELDRHLAQFRPQVVVMDGLFEETAGTIGLDDLLHLKSCYDFKLVILLSDTHPPLPNFGVGWAPAADLTIGLSHPGYLTDRAYGRTFISPCQPMAASILHRTEKTGRPIDLLYAGSRRRNRDFWCAHAVAAGIEATISLTDRRADTALSETELYDMLSRARLVINNGFVAPDIDVVTFRIFEASALGVLTLQNGAAVNDYFVPYIHFVPVQNVHELVCFARFLLSHEEYRRRMSEEAEAFVGAHYRAEFFWRALFARIG